MRSTHNPTRPKQLRKKLIPALAALFAILGASVFLYPQAAQWLNQIRQAEIVNAYSELLDDAEPSEAVQIERARRYNEFLAGGALVEVAGNVPTIREQGEQEAASETLSAHETVPYSEQLLVDSNGLMGRIKVPSADIDVPIYHGTSDSTLLKGAGHLQGTALPVGGEGNRTVITAHRGLASATMFTHLDRVGIGDDFTIEVFGQLLAYRVVDIKVVEPDAVQTVRAEPGRDLATLITCTPLGINSQRLVVTGERVLPVPADIEEKANADSEPGFPWWIIWWLLVALGALAYYAYMMRLQGKDASEPKAQGADASEPAAPTPPL